MTIGGTVSANAHGHCLGAPPIVSDMEWIEIATADNVLQKCSRTEEKELFSLAIGGYGLFESSPPSPQARTPAQSSPQCGNATPRGGDPFSRKARGQWFGVRLFSVQHRRNFAGIHAHGILTTYEIVGDDAPLGDASTDIDEAQLASLLELPTKIADRPTLIMRIRTVQEWKRGVVGFASAKFVSSGYHKLWTGISATTAKART